MSLSLSLNLNLNLSLSHRKEYLNWWRSKGNVAMYVHYGTYIHAYFLAYMCEKFLQLS